MFENGHGQMFDNEESNFSQESVISSWDNLPSENPDDDEVKYAKSHSATYLFFRNTIQ